MWTKLRTLLLVVRHGEFREILDELRRRLWSTEVSFCLRRDLAAPFEAPRARVPFEIRPLCASDEAEVLRERPRRLPILRGNVPTCYVAVAEGGEIAYMQWLMTSASNAAIGEIFGGRVPPLSADEALLEFAYTFEAWRGKNIMPRAMALIAEKAGDEGCRHVMTYVREENVPALKGCQRAGFQMFRRQAVTWCAFVRVRVETSDLPAGTRYPFEAAARPATRDLTIA